MTAVRVASYNILCSTLAPPDRFCHCAPQDLEASARLPRILRQLDAEVDAGAVVCLQEVGREWCGRLHKYFADKGFHFVHSGYGERFNDYMGVGIAFPTSKFKLVDSSIKFRMQIGVCNAVVYRNAQRAKNPVKTFMFESF